MSTSKGLSSKVLAADPLANRLTDENQAVCVETLAVKNILKNHSLTGAIADAAWLGILQQVNGGIRHLTQGPLQVMEERDRISISVIQAVPGCMLAGRRCIVGVQPGCCQGGLSRAKRGGDPNQAPRLGLLNLREKPTAKNKSIAVRRNQFRGQCRKAHTVVQSPSLLVFTWSQEMPIHPATAPFAALA